uniref:Uncharacterized protein n=1 Tax=Arundo donax TaxID=35708 RepID=A0A0A9GSD1_ARUDO
MSRVNRLEPMLQSKFLGLFILGETFANLGSPHSCPGPFRNSSLRLLYVEE